MRFTGKRDHWRSLVLVPPIMVVLVLPGALHARLSVKPTEIVVHNCKVASLVAAVDEANATATADTIALKKNCTFTFASASYDSDWGPSALNITAPLTIRGNGATIARDPAADPFRLITVLGWNSTEGVLIENVTFRGGDTQGDLGGGGAVVLGDTGMSRTLSINGCTFSDNSAVWGGAIWNPSWPPSALVITNSTFTGNSAELNGGAVSSSGTRLTLSGDSFEDNHVTQGGSGEVRGGGAVAYEGDALAIRDSSFLDNDTLTDYGGAIAFGGGSAIVERSTFTSNSESGQGVGGAIWIQGAPGGFRVSDSTFTANSAGSGAAISLEGGLSESNLIRVTGSTFDRNTGHSVIGAINGPDGDIVVANSTFSDSALAGGNAIGSWGGSVDLTNTTVARTTNGAAVGLSNYQGVVTAGTVRNSILHGSGGVLCSGWPVTDGGGNLVFGGGGCPATMTWADPLLLPLADNGGPTQTMAPGAGSPAIDGAIDATCAAPVGPPLFGAGGVDQRGVTRPQGPHCDIGAYELVP